MADNSKKTPFGLSFNQASQKKILDQVQLRGHALPCHVIAVRGSIVKVAFDVASTYTLPSVWMPMFGPTYIRYPTQIGDLGMTVPADVFLGGVSGLGGGTADLSQRANLSTLVWLPISNTGWSEVDPNSVNINGPNGVVLRDTSSQSTVVLTPTAVVITGHDDVQIISGPSSITISRTGSITMTDGTYHTSLELMNQVWAAFVAIYNSHNHGGVQSGGSNTAIPNQLYTGSNIAPT